jgi:hypothetical protein
MSTSSRLPQLSIRLCAYGLFFSVIVGIFALAHHPTFHSTNMASAPGALAKVAWLNTLVHGGMIAVTMFIFLCLVEYSMLRNWRAFFPRSAIIMFGFGVVAVCGAALVNGFIVPDFIVLESHAQGIASNQAELIASLLWSVNQRLMALGAYFIAASVLLWSVDLLVNTPHYKKIALAGLFLGIGQLAWQLHSHSNFNLHNMQLFWLWLSAWSAILAWIMWSVSQPKTR